MKDSSIQMLLQQGITLAKAAHGKSNQQPKRSPLERAKLKKQAREMLIQVTELDARSVQAWLWLSTVIDNPADKRVCLKNVLALEPGHTIAQKGIVQLEQQARVVEQKTTAPAKAQPALAAPSNKLPYQRLQPTKPTPAEGCPFCGQPLSDRDSTCPHCRAPLVVECPACNALMDVEWTACTECAQPLGDYRRGAAYFIDLADHYEQQQRARQALESLRVAEQMSPERSDLPGRIGAVLLRQGKMEEAIDMLMAAVEREPEQTDPYLALGQAFVQAKQPGKARKAFEFALGLDPKSAAAQLALGELLLVQGDFKAARKQLQAATRLDPFNGHVWAQLGTTYDELGQHHQAVSAYREAEHRLSPASIEWQDIHRRLQILNPQLPAGMASSWGELSRQLSGPLLIWLLAVLLDSGLRPWWINWSGWLSLPLAGLGSLLWVSATLPQNPIATLVAGQEAGLERSSLRSLLATGGIALWLLAMGLILLPVGQSFPEAPF